MEGPIRVKELGDMASEMPAAQTSSKSDRFSSEALFRILSSFPRKTMNTKVEDNFMAHKLDTKFALFGVRKWDICAGKEGLQIRKIWTSLSFWKPSPLLSKEDLMQGEVEHAPRLPQGYKYKPQSPQEGEPLRSIHQRAAKKEIHRRKPTAAASLRGYLGDGLCHP
jgi:hypothetical protein